MINFNNRLCAKQAGKLVFMYKLYNMPL